MSFKRRAIATAVEIFRPSTSVSGIASIILGSSSAVEPAIGQSVQPSVVSFDYDPENFVYFRCRAITANTPNGNGDMFPADHLKQAYKSFIGVGLYKDHDSDSVGKSIGKVIWADYIPVKDGNDYVECVCSVDRKLDPDMARRVETGMASTVSMGCSVGEAECGICHNIARNQSELCAHMSPAGGVKGKKYGEKDEIAYEINRSLLFTELSLVTVPADPTAKIFEVFAQLSSGKLSSADAQKMIREALSQALSDISKSDVSKRDAISVTESKKPAEPVAKILNNTEEPMNFIVSYKKGTDLANSFFVAKEGSNECRVSVAEVMPLRVQEAIRAREPGVAAPENVCSEIASKCASISAFKTWAKKRKKKNKKALEKMQEALEEKKEESASDAPIKSASPAIAEPAPASDVVPAPMASTDVLDPAAVSADPAQDTGDSDAHVEPATGNPAMEVSLEDLQLALQDLQQRIEERKMTSSKRQATTKQEVTDRREDGEKSRDGKYAPAAEPQSTAEVTSKSEPEDMRDAGEETGGKYSPAPDQARPGSMKSEEPKGHVDQGSSTGNKYAPAKVSGSAEKALSRSAADGMWSVNQKELEAKPKMSKPLQASPTDVALDTAEMASEQVKLDKGGNAGSKVKKYFNRLPAGGLGEAPKALDLKSSADPEKEALRRENAALKEKERLTHVAEKIYEVVKALREKNILSAEAEGEVISHLGGSFKDIATLDSVLGLVAKLSTAEQTATVQPGAEAESGVEVGGVIPQVFETVTQTEDPISTMAQIWNL